MKEKESKESIFFTPLTSTLTHLLPHAKIVTYIHVKSHKTQEVSYVLNAVPIQSVLSLKMVLIHDLARHHHTNTQFSKQTHEKYTVKNTHIHRPTNLHNTQTIQNCPYHVI